MRSEATLTDVAGEVRSGVKSAVSIASETLRAIEDRDEQLAAFTHVDPNLVYAQASRIDKLVESGLAVGPLAGVPMAVKDVIDVRGLPTSYGSRSFDDYVAAQDSHSVARLRDAGALIVGKTRTSEFVWGLTTPPTQNPLKPDWVAGGSSGGSAAAVGASLVAGALGTDTGGSIRIPAALCGVAGLKPTYGLVGRSGILPGHWLFDHVGPIARSVSDLITLLSAMIGHDPGDPATDRPYAELGPLGVPQPNPDAYLDLARTRIGVFDDRLFEFVDPSLERRFHETLNRLVQCGAELVTIRLDVLRYVVATLLAVDLPGSAGIHTDRIINRPESIDPALLPLMRLAHRIPGVLVERAHRARRVIQTAMARTFTESRLDALVTPGLVAPPVSVGEEATRFERSDGSFESVFDAYVRPCALASVTGLPAVVIPDGLVPVPASVQLIGRPFRDFQLMDLARQLEKALHSSRET